MERDQISLIVAEIRNIHRRRVFAIKTQSKLDRSLESYIRIYHTNWTPDGDEKERKKANAEVKKLIARARKGEGERDILDLVEMTDSARAGFDAKRAEYEKGMTVLTKELPIISWVDEIRGFGALGLAIILGEAGDLSSYDSDAKLWKRLGLAVMDGLRQGGLSKNASADDWILHGYNRARRSRIWTLGDSLIKSQVRKVLDGDGEDTGERYSLGLYGEIYLKRKAYEKAHNPEMTDMHAHRRAQRYMEKKLLRHLWREWRRAAAVMPEKAGDMLPSAPNQIPRQANEIKSNRTSAPLP